MFKMKIFCGTALLAGFAMTMQSAAPKGWFLAGSKPAEYQTDVDAATLYNSQPSAFLKATTPVKGFGTLMQQFAAGNYAGQRVRFSAFVKSDSVTDWAGLWMRIDKGQAPVGFDNMQSRPIKGTLGWQHYEVVLDVPTDATGIAFGILLSGQGTVWINSSNFEVVGTGIPVTSVGGTAASGPTNLSFEK